MAKITHSSPPSGTGERASRSPDPPEHLEAGLEEEEETPEEQEPEQEDSPSAPPLPDEDPPPPLPNEAPPGQEEEDGGGGDDDGWEPVWDAGAQTFYFYNRFSGAAQWENPRVPDAAGPGPGPGLDAGNEEKPEPESASAPQPPVAGGYNPAIHGDYDPTAPYAQQHEQSHEDGTGAGAGADGTGAYEAAGAFNRFTGKWQAMTVTPENYNDENKSRRQMNAFFDVDAAANSHDGRSLRAERSAKKLSRKEVKAFREKRREKKEEKRRAWLRD
ncbi:WW domain-containing protein [Aspergillus sp. HF37]|nr:WW domain-containing protein [Aspergillus sp. HF37]